MKRNLSPESAALLPLARVLAANAERVVGEEQAKREAEPDPSQETTIVPFSTRPLPFKPPPPPTEPAT